MRNPICPNGPGVGAGASVAAMNGRNFWYWFGGIWLAVGLPFLMLGGWFAWYELTLEQRLALSGRTAQGMVLVKSWGTGNSSGRQSDPRVKYRFTTADGKTIHAEATVTESAWDALREREAVEVSYLPGTPRANRIDGRPVQWVLPLVFSAVGGILTLIAGFILLKASANARFARRLRTQGLTAEAEISHVAPTGYMVNRVYQWAVYYRYRDHAGNEHEGRSPPMPEELARRWQPGDHVQVMFDRLRPGRSAWPEQT